MTAVAPLEIRRPPDGTGAAGSQDYREHVEGLLISLLDGVVRSHEPALAGITTGTGKIDVAQTGLAIKALQAIGLRHHFEIVISGEECPRGKPHPDPYLAALDSLGAAAAGALAFEDSPSGLAAAVAAGIPVVGVTSTLPASELLALGAFATISDFTDTALEPILDRLKGVPA